jgi:hypothetical protein
MKWWMMMMTSMDQNEQDQKYRSEKQKEHQGRVDHYKKTVAKYNGIVNTITGLYNTAESLDDNPDGWLQKAEVFGMILEKVGDLHYISIQAWKYADALKKETYALAIISERPKGRTTDQHREMAVLESQEWRWKIGEWEGYTKRWENAKDTITEQINILKKKVTWEVAHMNAQVGGNQIR